MIRKFESFTNDEMTVKAMNKALYFFANCGYNEVKKLLFAIFDEYLAEHIFEKYNNSRADMPFLETFFKVDGECKKEILTYIAQNYNSEPDLK